MGDTLDARIRIKRSTLTGEEPTIPGTADHLDGTWLATDIYIGEIFLNQADNKAWIRTDSGVERLSFYGDLPEIIGTDGRIPVFGAANALGNSLLSQSGNFIYIDSGKTFSSTGANSGILNLKATYGFELYGIANGTKAWVYGTSTHAGLGFGSSGYLDFTENGAAKVIDFWGIDKSIIYSSTSAPGILTLGDDTWTQIRIGANANAKIINIGGANDSISFGTVGADKILITGGTGYLTESSATPAELDCLTGVTGNVQSQIDDITTKYKGVFVSEAALNTAHPTANAGDYANVDGGVGVDTIRYLWDGTDSAWVQGGGIGNVESVNGQIGIVVLDQDDIGDGTTYKQYSGAEKTKLAAISGTNTGDETTTTIGALINGATNKATPVDADYIGLMDSAASNILKKLSWANIKATLKTYFDTLYESVTNKDATGGYAGLTLFKINFKNVANTFTSFFTNTNTAARTYTFQDRDGTIADIADVYFNVEMESLGQAPADATIYYFGVNAGGISPTTANGRKQTVPFDCTLIAASIIAINLTATATNEASTLNFRLNNTTDVLLSNTVVFNGAPPVCNSYNTTGLSTNLTAGDTFEIKWTTPTWTTNPGSSSLKVVLYFKRR
jgi:hypothetical protein